MTIKLKSKDSRILDKCVKDIMNNSRVQMYVLLSKRKGFFIRDLVIPQEVSAKDIAEVKVPSTIEVNIKP